MNDYSPSTEERLTLYNREHRKFGPKKSDHPSIGECCLACKMPFKEGDYTTLVSLGPGDDKESMERAREGRAYNAVAVEVHYSCNTGVTNDC